MTNLVTYADFTGLIHLDLPESGEQTMVTAYITKYQEVLLKKLFGVTLYNTINSDVTSKYTLLKNGDPTAYTYNSEVKVYSGLKNMIANYVYYQYNQCETTHSTTMGETQSTNQAGNIVVNINKQVRAWNEMVRLYYEAIGYIDYQNSLDTSYADDFYYETITYINSFGI